MKSHALSFVVATALALLAGCAGVIPEKRHSPQEIAAYRVTDFAAAIASTEGERREREEAMAKIRAAQTPLSVSPDARVTVANALDAISMFNTDRDTGRALVLSTLTEMERYLASFSNDQQRNALSAAYTYYAAESAPQLKRLLPQLATPRQFAIAAYAVLKADPSAATRAWLRETWRTRFPDGANEPRLQALEHVLAVDTKTELQRRPPLVDLLAAPLRANLPVVFSFQRRDRQQIGLAMVRGADGKFIRNADGSYFQVPQLAMALTNLPGTITNGNTPQGLFTVVGAGTATNKWIGPTPYLESKIPIEGKVEEFTHSAQSGEWTDAFYDSFLPETWRGYWPFKEALLAGRAGRDEMLMHGTTVNSEYYRGQSFYPGTPSAGCLVAVESWSLDGKLLKSDQLSLAKAFTSGGVDRGYLVVVEIDDRAARVTIEDVIADVMAAEALRKN